MPEIIGKVIISLMKKSLILLFSLVVACSFSSCIQSVPSLSSSSDETVMLHWLDMDQEGLVRKTMDDGNATKRDSLFSGKAIGNHGCTSICIETLNNPRTCHTLQHCITVALLKDAKAMQTHAETSDIQPNPRHSNNICQRIILFSRKGSSCFPEKNLAFRNDGI